MELFGIKTLNMNNLDKLESLLDDYSTNWRKESDDYYIALTTSFVMDYIGYSFSQFDNKIFTTILDKHTRENQIYSKYNLVYSNNVIKDFGIFFMVQRCEFVKEINRVEAIYHYLNNSLHKCNINELSFLFTFNLLVENMLSNQRYTIEDFSALFNKSHILFDIIESLALNYVFKRKTFYDSVIKALLKLPDFFEGFDLNFVVRNFSSHILKFAPDLNS